MGISEGPWSECCSWVDTAGLHLHHGDHMDPRNAPPIGQGGGLNCDGVSQIFHLFSLCENVMLVNFRIIVIFFFFFCILLFPVRRTWILKRLGKFS